MKVVKSLGQAQKKGKAKLSLFLYFKVKNSIPAIYHSKFLLGCQTYLNLTLSIRCP